MELCSLSQKKNQDVQMVKISTKKAAKVIPKELSQKESTYLLRIPEDLRREIRIEALTRDTDMSKYICSILRKRSR
jgi:predicted DNA binding CopG/RHH family protein